MEQTTQQNVILEGIHYSSNKVIRVGIRSGFIFSLTDTDKIYRGGEEEREQLPVIAPGLTDLQINGFGGIDFNHPEISASQIESASHTLLKTGVTCYYPTLVTGSRKRISSAIRAFAEVIQWKKQASHMIGGIHLEGPFISKEEGPRGAHPKRYCLNPSIDLLKSWQEEADGHIRMVTLAPELPGSGSFIKACIGMGIVVAIGHMAATSDQIRSAAEAGATLSTHLGNGSHSLLPRHPNYIWDQLADDRLYASMIADGFHLPDNVLKVFIRTKGEKAILVSDGMPYTGMEPGTYDSPVVGKVILTREGKIHREGEPGKLAGSSHTLLDGVKKISLLEGFARAWDMASVYPSKLLNHGSNPGLQVGAPADLVLLEPDLKQPTIRMIYKNGTPYGDPVNDPADLSYN